MKAFLLLEAIIIMNSECAQISLKELENDSIIKQSVD